MRFASPRSIVRAAFVLTILAGAQALSAQAQAVAPAPSAGSAWEMSLDDTPRRCRMTLRADPAPGGQAIAAPAGCRKALPILTHAAAWAPADNGALRLVATNGETLLAFGPQGRELVARGPEGETYRLSAQGPTSAGGPIGAQLMAQAQTPGFVTPTAPRGASAAPAVVPAAAPAGAAPARGAIPGRYAVMREGRDTGCMITLEDRPGRGPRGSLRAFLAPACRDQGLVIYDPVGWAFNGGKLTLYARKGHATGFLISPDGIWLKDASEGGKPLGLKRI
jgi:hypothetical protein